MYYIELLSKNEIQDEDFLVFYDNFDCVFTQYKENNMYNIEVLFKDHKDIELFIDFCGNKKNSSQNPIHSLVDKPTIKTFKYEEADNWINYLGPINITEDFRIVPPWHSLSESNDIIINPSLAFGTGHHETTRSCLDLLLKTKDSSFLTKPINSILDIGSGSGILSIFSSLIFQCKVNGIDIDLEAINQSLSNLRLNSKVSNVDFKLKNLEEADGNFDLIIINISLDYLLSKLVLIEEKLNKSGVLIISGFLFIDIKDLNFLLKDAKFVIINIIHLNDWVSMVLKKK
jgi:ribosomal protein L11 methyltransferase|tara:strand:+ start:11448 stop:12308 length:861 start_codon:yes stop_codon:yes gene_type:complete